MNMMSIEKQAESCAPGMVKRVKEALVRPRVCRWVETHFSGIGSMNFTDEGEGAVEMGVPCNGANTEKGGRSKSCTRVN